MANDPASRARRIQPSRQVGQLKRAEVREKDPLMKKMYARQIKKIMSDPIWGGPR